MMKILSGILEKIKSRLAARKTGDELSDILGITIQRDFLFFTGEETGVSLTRLTAEDLEKHPAVDRTGFIAAGLSGYDEPRIIVFYPAELMRQILPVIKARHSSAGESDAALIIQVIDRVIGSISRFIADTDARSIPENDRLLFLKKPYSSIDKNALLWQASGCSIFKVTAGSFSYFLMIRDEIENMMRSHLREREFLKEAFKLARSEYDPAASIPPGNESAALHIKKPKEFIAGNSLVPQSAMFGAIRIASVFKSITAHGPGGAEPADGLWIRSIITSGNIEAGIYYRIAGLSRKEFTDRFGDPAPLFKNILREVLAFLKTNSPALSISSIRIDVDTKPDRAALAGSISLGGEFFINYSRMELEVLVPASYLALLFRIVLKPWEYRSVGSMAALISLNMTYFGKNITSFMRKYRSGPAYLPVATTCMPVYEFIDLLDDRDLRIIIQNFLVPRYAASFPCIFNIGIQARNEDPLSGTKPMRIFQVAYNRERFNRMIPAAMMEEVDRRVNYTMADEFDSFNKSIMKEISKAITLGRITVSYKTRFILMHEVYGIINEDESRHLMELRSKGIPFKNLQKLPRVRMVNFINRAGNLDLCKSVVDLEEEKNLLLSCMSRSRKKQFNEDMDYVRDLYMNARITVEEIISAKLKIHELLEKEARSRNVTPV